MKTLTAAQLERQARSLIGHRRSGEIRLAVTFLPDGRFKQPVTAVFSLELAGSIWECRLKWYCLELYGGRAIEVALA